MTIKTILVPLAARKRSEVVLATALAAAQRFGAHFEAFHVRRAPEDMTPFMVDGLSTGLRNTVLKEASDDAAERAAGVRAVFDEFCVKNGVPMADKPSSTAEISASWHEETGRSNELLVRRGRLFDLTVTARPAADPSRVRRSPAGEHLESMLLETGRPILLAPSGAPKSYASNVAIGWNGSAEAAHAVAAAMPCLTAADKVTLLTSRKREDNTKDLAQQLLWHDIKALVHVFETGSSSVSETLLTECKKINADLLVVGGYTRTRARQLLFGGVTSHVLADADIPVFMTH